MSQTRKEKKARKETQDQGLIYAVLLPDGISEFSEDQIQTWASEIHRQWLYVQNRDSLHDQRGRKRQ
jgi:hypothetical protein